MIVIKIIKSYIVGIVTYLSNSFRLFHLGSRVMLMSEITHENINGGVVSVFHGTRRSIVGSTVLIYHLYCIYYFYIFDSVFHLRLLHSEQKKYYKYYSILNESQISLHIL